MKEKRLSVDEHCVNHVWEAASWQGRAKMRDFADQTQLYDESRYDQSIPDLIRPIGPYSDTCHHAAQTIQVGDQTVVFRETTHSDRDHQRVDGPVKVGYLASEPYMDDGLKVVDVKLITDSEAQEEVLAALKGKLGQRDFKFVGQ